jgi:hypothetical protein
MSRLGDIHRGFRQLLDYRIWQRIHAARPSGAYSLRAIVAGSSRPSKLDIGLTWRKKQAKHSDSSHFLGNTQIAFARRLQTKPVEK